MNKIRNLVTLRHGSHLYGMARPDSDIDLYTVYDFLNKNYRPKKQTEQTIEGETDHVKISLDSFKCQLIKGVPQACEVLWARPEHWLDYSPDWEMLTADLEHLVQDNAKTVLNTYKRTVMNFFAEENFKKNRHGFRLIINASEFKKNGVFNPTLTSQQVDTITILANKPWGERHEKYKDMLWEVFR